MKKLLTITSLVLVSGSVFAGSDLGNTEIRTSAFDSKQQAYEAGYDLVKDLKAMPHGELAHELKLNGHDTEFNSIELNNTEIVVQELAEKQGVIKYRAVVDVNYQYDAKDS
ncbi:hypothetical protein VME0621_04647 [Vibrio mediterranei]|uniref:DUF3316 domain-containing protein n=1 Tax=Vibrio mediterranei TaxID=689 RepID=A0ABX5D8M8_9VIBR|nr:DUF3316 domain-containing protein [Vibrio mediterranei]PCD86664.1 DUF3316 domain-containing protein [Vibrio mediterranei]PRQ66013.1 DUF3316 domain-containing protein [Vibrio mediterranei]SBO12493.1 hypothetical protein VME0621_04647 [Vibrio mediterranei]